MSPNDSDQLTLRAQRGPRKEKRGRPWRVQMRRWITESFYLENRSVFPRAGERIGRRKPGEKEAEERNAPLLWLAQNSSLVTVAFSLTSAASSRSVDVGICDQLIPALWFRTRGDRPACDSLSFSFFSVLVAFDDRGFLAVNFVPFFQPEVSSICELIERSSAPSSSLSSPSSCVKT